MILEVQFGEMLRASEQASIHRISLYLADTNKYDHPVPNLHKWVEKAVNLLTDINSGCTRLPQAYGTWQEDDVTTFEHSIIIYSYIRDPRKFIDRLDEIVSFVHTFGREAEQKAVMVELAGGGFGQYFSQAYFITQADYLDL